MKKFLTGIIVFLLLLSIIGCSDTKKTTEGNTPNMDIIKKRGKVIVATEAAFAPFEFMENGKIVGYNIDILQEVMKSLNVELEHLDVIYTGLFTGLDAKKFDFIVTSLIITPERREKIGLTTPVADVSIIYIKRKGDDSIKTKDDIDGKTIGCQINTLVEKKLIAYDEKLKAEGKAGFKELKNYSSYPELYMDLKNGRIDLVPQMKPAASYLLKQEPGIFEIIEFENSDDITGGKRYIGWGTRKEDKDILNFLNEELLKLKKNGKLAEIQRKWFDTTWELPDEV